MVNSFDVEAQCRAHLVNVFSHDSLNYSRLAGVVKSSDDTLETKTTRPYQTHNISTRISLSFKRALRRMDSILVPDSVSLYLHGH